MRRPEHPTGETRQAQRTIRTLLRDSYPLKERKNRTYDRASFVELASIAAARRQSVHHVSQSVSRLPDSDTFHQHLHAYKADEVLEAFQRTLDQIVGIAGGFGWLRPCDVALDRHDEANYGKDHTFTVGCKNRRGTNHAHAYLTSQRLAEPRLSLDLERLHPFRSQHEALSDLLEHTEKRQPVTTYYADKAFYNRRDLALLVATGKNFVVAVPQSKHIQRLEKEVIRTRVPVHFGRFVATTRHRVGGDDGPEVVLVFHWEPDPTKKTGEHLFVYATRNEASPEQLHAWAEQYRSRWGIETGYRIQDRLRIRTSTTAYPNRLYLSCLAVLLDCAWRLVRHARTRRDPTRPVLTLNQFLDQASEPAAVPAA